MFEFHGWAVLNSASDGVDEYDNRRLEQLRKELERLDSISKQGIIVHEVANGMQCLTLSGLRNHRDGQIVDLFRWLAANGKSAYGLLYIRDDEDSDVDNAFRVFRLAKSLLTEEMDSLLSPCIPTIEDPFDP